MRYKVIAVDPPVVQFPPFKKFRLKLATSFEDACMQLRKLFQDDAERHIEVEEHAHASLAPGERYDVRKKYGEDCEAVITELDDHLWAALEPALKLHLAAHERRLAHWRRSCRFTTCTGVHRGPTGSGKPRHFCRTHEGLKTQIGKANYALLADPKYRAVDMEEVQHRRRGLYFNHNYK